jgi:hypothetical protein
MRRWKEEIFMMVDRDHFKKRRGNKPKKGFRMKAG